MVITAYDEIGCNNEDPTALRNAGRNHMPSTLQEFKEHYITDFSFREK
jgi:hypothetical protein